MEQIEHKPKETKTRSPKKETQIWNLDKIKEQMKEDPEGLTLIAIGGVSLFAIVFLDGIVATGIFLGVCTALSMLLLVFKTKGAKPRVWNTIVDHPLAADIALSFSVIALSATGVTGLVAGVMGALFTSAAIKYAVEHMGKAVDPETGKPYESYKLPFFGKKEEEELNGEETGIACAT